MSKAKTPDTKELTHRLARAKTLLVLDHPFFGSLALQMPFIIDPNMKMPPQFAGMKPTAMVDGKRVTFHPDFIDELNDEELLFVVAHEICHPLFEHTFRRNDRDPMGWNMAADYVINYHLKEEGIGTMPPSGLYDKKLFEDNGGVTEHIYDALPKDESGKTKDKGDGTGPLDNCADGQGSEADLAEQAQEWKIMAAQAAQAAKMMGKLSAGMERLVSQILEAKVDWREVLSRFVERQRTDVRSFSRGSRRFASLDLILPGISGESMGELVIAIDCSGSVSPSDLDQFSAEVCRIMEDSKPKVIHAVYFDSRVCHYEQFTPDGGPVQLTPHGGGGTAFSPVMQYINEHSISPVACVFLTDLYCSDFGTPPEYPVLWVTYGATEAPWGEVVRMG